MELPLWDHQREAVGRATSTHNFAFFFEMGTGKSRTLIETLIRRFTENRGILKTIIFTPPIVVPQFRQEFFKYSNIPKKDVVALQGSQVKRIKTFLEANGAPKVFITNYEALNMKDLYQLFLEYGAEVIALDESQKVKSPTSQRAKLANALANPRDKKTKTAGKKPHTYLLTGTPVLNSPMDLFQQYLVMDGGKTFGDNFFAFRAKYFRDRNAHMPRDRHFPDWQIRTFEKDGFDALSEINRKLLETSMRVEKSECLDLPPEVDITIKVGMSPEQQRLYNQMKKDLITYMGDKACVATMALTKALRLMQIASGFVSLDGDDGQIEVSLDDTPKLEALKELLEEICADPKNKVIVWSCWKKTYGDIGKTCDALGLKRVEIHGDITESRKKLNVDAFRSDPSVRVLIGHPGSGGVGLNLVEAGYSIRYSRTFSLEQWLQSRARNHRGGSLEAGHKSIVHYELVAENTIEEIAVQKLAMKIDMSDSLLSNLISDLKNQGE